MKTEATAKTNDIRHNIDINDARNNILINIRLNDECNNGHQDFSITGSRWGVGKARTERNMISCGSIHSEILKARPDLKIFVNLHLCDYSGVPMYAASNGFYHIKNGFTGSKPSNESFFKKEYCNYYRINHSQFDALIMCENEKLFSVTLKNMGILKQWKEEADQAIKLLEELTNTEFINDSKKSHYKN